MPWCDPCSAYHAPTAVDDGLCPTCGGAVADAPDTQTAGADGDAPETVGQSAPWHFWIVVVALAAYLSWRAVVGVIWLIGTF